VSPVTVQWQGSSCLPNLNIDQLVLSDTNPACSLSGGGNYQCVLNLSYDPGSPSGGIFWVGAAGLASVTPPNGTLATPGQSTAVTIANLPCSQAVFIIFTTQYTPNTVTWDADPACSGSGKANIKSPLSPSTLALGDVKRKVVRTR
jgi:hypothetical protein